MNNIIIGTAGHVDHGKTCLIRALTGIETDRLREEKKRGITIELGFAYLDLPDGGRAGIIDVPGHEKFVRNMLAGAGGIDLALLIVAADEGVMPQTVEHLGILSLLEIQHGIIVLTKTDMVDEDWRELVAEDIRSQVKGTFLEDAPLIPVSSYTGEGIEELRQEIFRQISLLGGKKAGHPLPYSGGPGLLHGGLWHGHHRYPDRGPAPCGGRGVHLPPGAGEPGAQPAGPRQRCADRLRGPAGGGEPGQSEKRPKT